MMKQRDDFNGVDLGNATAKQNTGLALRVFVDDLDREMWIPLSQIHDDSEVFDAEDNATGNVVVTLWFAEKERLV